MHIFLTSSPTGDLDGSRPVKGIDSFNQFLYNLKKDFWKKGLFFITPLFKCLYILYLQKFISPKLNIKKWNFFIISFF